MRPTIATLCAVLAMVGWTSSASAQAQKDNTAEIVAGVVFPLGEDEYENFLDPSFKFGGRIAFYGQPKSRGPQAGLEIGFDWTPAENDLDDIAFVDASFNRFRILAGARLRKPLGSKASVFFRAAAGVDFIMGHVEEELLGTDWDENDLGVALEFGGGVAARLGNMLIGFQAALPIAFHWEDDPEQYDYTGYDVDFLFTVGSAF